jgi:hypothetical protein
MAGKHSVFEEQLLYLILQGVSIPNIADNAATSPLTDLYISLHTSDPTDAANQSTNEVTNPGYARIPISRTSSIWLVVGGIAQYDWPTILEFPVITGGASTTATHFGLGTSPTGAGKLLYFGPLTTPVPIEAGVQVIINQGNLTIYDEND